MKEVLLQFDGGSRGNPGISGAGAVIYVDNEEKISACIPVFEQITNNQAEYLGLKEGLKIAVEEGFKIIKIQGDSLLVINQVKGTWKVKNKNLKIIKDEMENAFKLSVPLDVEIGIGNNWLEAH